MFTIESDYEWQVNLPADVQISHSRLHPVILQLLKNRGIKTREELNRFLDPRIDYLYDPMLLKDMDKAVSRIKKAIANSEKITVYGDYDVDGITSCCMMVRLLRKMGAKVDYYIPSRLDEGYGLNKEAVKKIHGTGATLIITVDNGISSFEEVEFASELGIDTVITDHHEPRDTIPKAVAVVDPKRRDCKYPFKNLAGVGVALKLAHALVDMNFKSIQEYLDLAALGTVADIVPLLDENRIIVKNGIRALENTQNKGLSSLLSVLKLKDAPVDARKISFMLAPRLNAVGRISDPNVAVKLLLTEDEIEALELARTLENVNQERQSIETRILEEAREKIDNHMDLDEDRVIVISSPEWHPGVIGIVASRLVELYHRPCILIAEEGEEGRGSGRSIPGFNLFDALSRLSHKLLRYGGHEQAAGLAIKISEIGEFREEINALAKQLIKEEDIAPKLNIELELEEKDISLELAEQLELLEPFGFGNPKPVFMCRNLTIRKIQTVGGGDKHLRLSLNKKQKPLAAIGFNLGFCKEELDLAPALDLAFHLEVNRWQGYVEPQLNIKDMKVLYLKDDLLNRIEEGYFKRFLSKFCRGMTETFHFDTKPVLHEKPFSEKMNELKKRDYVKALFQQDKKVLVIINTPYQAWRLLVYLRNMEDLRNSVGVFYNPDTKEIMSKKNVILINPMVTCFDDWADDIVFYDTPFGVEILERQLSGVPPGSGVHLIFNRADLRYNLLVCQKMFPDLEGIRVIYGLVNKFTCGRFIGRINMREFTAILNDYLTGDLHYAGLINSFKIFNELGILDFTLENGFINITKYNKQDRKLKLDDSGTYRSLKAIRDMVVEFSRKF
jgi:single-stranded-DNA-specific exonuclease